MEFKIPVINVFSCANLFTEQANRLNSPNALIAMVCVYYNTKPFSVGKGCTVKAFREHFSLAFFLNPKKTNSLHFGP